MTNVIEDYISGNIKITFDNVDDISRNMADELGGCYLFENETQDKFTGFSTLYLGHYEKNPLYNTEYAMMCLSEAMNILFYFRCYIGKEGNPCINLKNTKVDISKGKREGILKFLDGENLIIFYPEFCRSEQLKGIFEDIVNIHLKRYQFIKTTTKSLKNNEVTPDVVCYKVNFPVIKNLLENNQITENMVTYLIWFCLWASYSHTEQLPEKTGLLLNPIF